MVQERFVPLFCKMKKCFFHLAPASEENRDLKEQAEREKAFHSILHKHPSGFFMNISLHCLSITSYKISS